MQVLKTELFINLGSMVFFYNIQMCWSDLDSSRNNGNLSTSSLDTLTSSASSGGAKSPLRSRKSSLSAVIDKLRLQHNSEGEIFPNGIV